MRVTEKAASNAIEKFQQECLALVLRVPRTVPRNELNRICAEKSTVEKCAVTANRLVNFCPRDVQQLKWIDGIIPTTRATRNHREGRWVVTDKFWMRNLSSF